MNGPTNSTAIVMAADLDPVAEVRRRVVEDYGCICPGGPGITEHPPTPDDLEFAADVGAIKATHFEVSHDPGCPALARTSVN